MTLVSFLGMTISLLFGGVIAFGVNGIARLQYLCQLLLTILSIVLIYQFHGEIDLISAGVLGLLLSMYNMFFLIISHDRKGTGRVLNKIEDDLEREEIRESQRKQEELWKKLSEAQAQEDEEEARLGHEKRVEQQNARASIYGYNSSSYGRRAHGVFKRPGGMG